eukprot:3773574-Amphidinium_carterae.1
MQPLSPRFNCALRMLSHRNNALSNVLRPGVGSLPPVPNPGYSPQGSFLLPQHVCCLVPFAHCMTRCSSKILRGTVAGEDTRNDFGESCGLRRMPR